MPESCKDRPTKAHEQVWMLTKQGKYFWDQEAVREPLKLDSMARIQRGRSNDHKWSDGGPGNQTLAKDLTKACNPAGRNIRSVWTLSTEACPEAHFATFPSKLVEIMVRAGSKKGDIILDPFVGVGTSVLVAEKLGRTGIGLDLSSEYLWDIAKGKIEAPLQKELF